MISFEIYLYILKLDSYIKVSSSKTSVLISKFIQLSLYILTYSKHSSKCEILNAYVFFDYFVTGTLV